jgi:V-type H+-transporting ATPase subunit E
MMERNLNIELKQDHAVAVEKLFPDCQNDFSEIILKETGKVMESKLALSEYSLEEKNQHIIGGIFLRSSDGVIVCDNSLDSRVRLIFEQLLPTIRASLFPARHKTS